MIQKVLESACFHTTNSGVTVSIDMTETINRCGDHVDVDYRMKAIHSANGVATEVSFPLGSDHMMDYLIEALTRIRQRMKNKDCLGTPAFLPGRKPSVDAYITMLDGLRREPVYNDPEETELVAFKFYDGNRVIKIERVDNPAAYSNWSVSKP